MRITILGCGSSTGVPMIGGNWGNCDPTNPKNRRRRASILVQHEQTTLLVDTPPDLHDQLVDANVQDVSAILYTHAHADHVHGIDEVRGLNLLTGRWIDCHADAATLDAIGKRFGYVFKPIEKDYFYKPCLTPHVIKGPFQVGSIRVTPFEQDHGYSVSTGFRFDMPNKMSAAYSTDVAFLSDAALGLLEGVDVWIVDCLRFEPHPTHAHFERTMEWVARVKPGRAVLHHMNHQADYEALRAACPSGVEPGYDGLVIEG
ncbi:MBL fold metallo-hydrolase [Oceanibaculum indicum]|uniref:Metallo-beta-lactamase superfamily protein n=1 Tax=Oceanibaculum indicum P24 TaxID=1207063 RepID=K2JK34_9PROT|nr:MBL fold metallo-hydrolase [Oceanibaculum indicum]EKE70924.1 metallo-beta-lactamase superfamily protein [Oceanibaculum indicum P24]